jgi:ubiquinone/menaquinone biosynthesis C-methylase UbiE
MKMNAIDANKIAYTKVAKLYNETEPHFFPENQSKVKVVLKEIRGRSGPKLLDIGCGTGFIINLAKDLFDEIHGIDISVDMLSRVDTSGGNITLHNMEAEKLSFDKDYFDVVTAYAVLHHLKNYEMVLQQAFNVLKKKGCFYIDLEPNKKYFELVARYKDTKDADYSEVVKKEIRSVCHASEKAKEDYGIDGEIFELAEYTKSVYGGIDAAEFEKTAKKIGFGDCEVVFNWYPGQGKVLHQQSEKEAKIIDNYLRETLPFSQCLYKYLRFILIK